MKNQAENISGRYVKKSDTPVQSLCKKTDGLR